MSKKRVGYKQEVIFELYYIRLCFFEEVKKNAYDDVDLLVNSMW